MTPPRGRTYIRAVDLAFTLLLLPIWGPLLCLGVVLALFQGLPVFYRANRLARAGTTFRMLKLRTMVRDAERLGPAVSTGEDFRITAMGKVLRRAKLDELPQFLHVLAGQMSLVGPRPEAPDYLRYYTAAGYRSLEAKPGITGYGALYFFSAERRSTSADFEERYLRDLLPTKLLLDERCWLDLQARPLRTTAELLWLTCAAVLLRGAQGFSPAQLEERFLRPDPAQ
jgi:lipopolysaccharide/colanic/teichoic acid biosynthesis glycosyltransferase